MEKAIRFIKYEGLGNDYIYIDCMENPMTDAEMSALSLRLSDRHFSVGGDGVVFIERGRGVDGVMRMFNADGSEGAMCGNAIRCVAKYLYDYKGIRTPDITVGTKSGDKRMRVTAENGRLVSARVDMGAPKFMPDDIPAKVTGEVIGRPLPLKVGERICTLVSMGNPHCVQFISDVAGFDVASEGSRIERDPLFPDRINAEFVELIGPNHIKMRVFERGSGETLACGTGACASVVAGVKNGFLPLNEEITVSLLGGDLKILYDGKTVYMDGPATETFSGIIR